MVDLIRILVGDALTRLRELADESVHCVVTSPPYWGLRCYGVEGQYGLEATPEEHVARMVAVFREVRRILRSDGVLFLNYGDSYVGGGGFAPNAPTSATSKSGQYGALGALRIGGIVPQGQLKPKDLVGMPWRVAFALQADGWWLRSDIIWSKLNPMPESVTDRPTKAHEYVFLLAKSAKYFYDADAVREPHSAEVLKQYAEARLNHGEVRGHIHETDRFVASQPDKANRGDGVPKGVNHNAVLNPAGRNLRSVWTIATHAFPEAHFACVDAETQCLTDQGWRTHEQIHPGMFAAQFDMAASRLSWAPVEDVARYDVRDEPLVVAQCRDVKMLLTPNHRTIIARRHPRSRLWQSLDVIRADELKPSHAVPVAGDWVEEGDEPVSPDWAELLGWYIAEGCEGDTSWSVEIYQSRSANPEKVDRIRSLLVAVGAHFTEAEATRKWRGEDRTLCAFQVNGFAAAYLRQWAPGKGFHPSVLRWSARLLGRLLDGLVDGDGHRRPDGRFSFIQRNCETAGITQAIGVRLGYATMLSPRSEETFSVYFTRKRLISFRGTGGEGARIETEPYTGIVWCPKLPAGTWVARKNGRAFITGNTFPPALVEPCIKAGTSERGCCAECGAPWERVVEKPQPQAVEGSNLDRYGNGQYGIHRKIGGQYQKFLQANPSKTTGWRPTCAHGGEPVPATVLDPFFGAGTVGLVADRLGRNAIGIELNPKYAAMAERRIREDLPMFAVVTREDHTK